jgi:hypothetical protein
MAIGVLFSLLLLVPGLTANLQPAVDKAELLSTCHRLAAEPDSDYEAFDRPQLEVPLSGFSRVWRGLGLDKRQTPACSFECNPGYGCCSEQNKGGCCQIGYTCTPTGCCRPGQSVCNNGKCCDAGYVCQEVGTLCLVAT